MQSRGQLDKFLTDALQTMTASDQSGGHNKWTIDGIEAEIGLNYDDYGASHKGMSRPSIKKALEGKEPISSHTSAVLRRFVKIHRPDLLRLIPKVDLDLGRFFGTETAIMADAGHAINGTFQTYARSTSKPDYMRLGRMSFTFTRDPARLRLQVEEEQYRPAMKPREPWRIIWDGYAAPRGWSYFIVMRTQKDDHVEGTASLGIVEVINRADGLIHRARFRGMQYDVELKNYQNFDCILIRTTGIPEITFVPLVEFDIKEIIADLCLEETISKLQQAARRREP